MLRTENLFIHIYQRPWFENLNLRFEPGSITAITGPNGIGKSTLLNHLSGIRKPTQGSVYLGAENLTSLKPSQRAQYIASLGQHDTALSDTLVKNRIAHGLLEPTEQAIHSIAEEFEIKHLLNRRLKQLSGGERKRVHIARCLVHSNARFYLLDEPDAGLDPLGLNQLKTALKQRSKAGKTVLLSLHNPHLTEQFDRLDLRQLCRTQLTR